MQPEQPGNQHSFDPVTPFTRHDYAACVQQCLPLLLRAHYVPHKILQLLLISYQRLGDASAVERFGQEILTMTAGTPFYHRLVKLTLGESDLAQVLEAAHDEKERCQAHYYAGMRLLTLGQEQGARAEFAACLAQPVECLERQLAQAESNCLDGQPPPSFGATTTVTPNPEHVQQVRRVLAKSDARLQQVLRQLGGRVDQQGRWGPEPVVQALLKQALDLCRPFWCEEFPDGWATGEQKGLDLRGADFSGGWFIAAAGFPPPLAGADLQGANLDGTRWHMGSLQNANLRGASLRNCVTIGLYCPGASFRQADLSGAVLQLFGEEEAVDFTEANLTRATFRLWGSPPLVLTGARLEGCRVISAVASPQDRAAYQAATAQLLDGLSDEQRRQISIEDFPAEARPSAPPQPEPGAPKSQCFLATAAYGSEHADEVVRLRSFRDTVLRRTWGGRAFIVVYEYLSPPVARLVARSALLRGVIRHLIVRPARRLTDSWGQCCKAR